MRLKKIAFIVFMLGCAPVLKSDVSGPDVVASEQMACAFAAPEIPHLDCEAELTYEDMFPEEDVPYWKAWLQAKGSRLLIVLISCKHYVQDRCQRITDFCKMLIRHLYGKQV